MITLLYGPGGLGLGSGLGLSEEVDLEGVGILLGREGVDILSEVGGLVGVGTLFLL